MLSVFRVNMFTYIVSLRAVSCNSGTNPYMCSVSGATVVHVMYSYCGITHSMILSFGLNGPRESRPSLLITCRHTNKETLHVV